VCGRFTLASPGETIAELFALDDVPRPKPRYNIAPTQPVTVVRLGLGERRELVEMRWGLVPSWAKDAGVGARMINARCETAAEKPAFRAALRRRRCLVAADGFFEWARAGNRKQPYHVRMADGRPFAFAGLWEMWSPPGGQALETCTILTTEPNDVVRPLHDRMPVIVDRADHAAWLDPATVDPSRLATLLRPYAGGDMVAYPVAPRVNDPGIDDSGCIARLA
jgi:putative SOS response-associated peptidase YedK